MTLPAGRERIDEVGRAEGLGVVRAGLMGERQSVYEEGE